MELGLGGHLIPAVSERAAFVRPVAQLLPR